jgi:hypothetical protein
MLSEGQLGAKTCLLPAWPLCYNGAILCSVPVSRSVTERMWQCCDAYIRQLRVAVSLHRYKTFGCLFLSSSEPQQRLRQLGMFLPHCLSPSPKVLFVIDPRIPPSMASQSEERLLHALKERPDLHELKDTKRLEEKAVHDSKRPEEQVPHDPKDSPMASQSEERLLHALKDSPKRSEEKAVHDSKRPEEQVPHDSKDSPMASQSEERLLYALRDSPKPPDLHELKDSKRSEEKTIHDSKRPEEQVPHGPKDGRKRQEEQLHARLPSKVKPRCLVGLCKSPIMRFVGKCPYCASEFCGNVSWLLSLA